MKKLTAKQALKIAEKGVEYSGAYYLIFSVSFDGETSLRCGFIPDEIIRELESLGYTVTYHDGKPNPYEVSWHNPK